MSSRTSKSDHRKQRSAVSVPPVSRSSTVSESSPADSSPKPNSIVGHTAAFIEPEQRHAMIAEAAYLRAERRGFEPGHEIEDWCGAEGEIDGALTRGEVPVACGV